MLAGQVALPAGEAAGLGTELLSLPGVGKVLLHQAPGPVLGAWKCVSISPCKILHSSSKRSEGRGSSLGEILSKHKKLTLYLSVLVRISQKKSTIKTRNSTAASDH